MTEWESDHRIPVMIKICEECGEQFTIYLGKKIGTVCPNCRVAKSELGVGSLEKGIREYIKSKNGWGDNWSLLSQGSGGCSHYFTIKVGKPRKCDNPEYWLFPNVTADDIERITKSCGHDDDLVYWWVKMKDDELHLCVEFLDGSH